MHKKNVVWLASYPKSGNTWFRVFMTNLLSDNDIPANINDLAETSISSSRRVFDDYTGLSSSDLSFEEIDKLRPDVYRMQSEESSELLFKKVHDQFYFVSNNQPLFPPEISKGAVYLIRNPLDVLVSFAYHSAKPVNKMINALNNPEYAFCDKNDKLQNQLRQILGSWSGHVQSWTEQKLIPVHVIRYEDMINNTFESFSNAIRFLGIQKTDQQIRDAIQRSDFRILSEQEKENGFKEKMIQSKFFFRKGKIGDWRNHLDNEIQNKIIENHKDTMIKFGYLTSESKLIY
ncbi:MAG: sulfotransferase domain-containing protein [Bacteroidales bacterium]